MIFFLLDLDVVRYCFCLILQPSFLPKLGTPRCVALSQLVQGEADTPGLHSSAGESGKQGQQSSYSGGSTSSHNFQFPEAA